MSTFTGFGPGLVDFYDGLAADNTRTWWLAHKDVYDTQVRDPLLALAADLTPRFGPPKVFRPNRDVRFSKDKRPYQDFASLAAEPPGGHSALYLQVSADGMLLAGGYYQPAPDQLARWREAVDDEVLAADLERTLTALDAAGFPLAEGDPVRTAPRGYAKDHPRIDLIRRRSLTVSRAYDPAPWWCTPEALDVISSGWQHIAAFGQWLDAHVGPSEIVVEERFARR